jgi:Protein of unknown function (DUF3592)
VNIPKAKVTQFIEALRNLAIGGFAFGALFWIPAMSFYYGSAVTVGQVVSFVERSTSEGGTSFHPVFSFSDSAGQSYSVTNSLGASPPDVSQGQSVPVRYRPQRPSEARIDSFFSRWGVPLLIQGVCVVHILLWSVVLRFLRRSLECERRAIA